MVNPNNGNLADNNRMIATLGKAPGMEPVIEPHSWRNYFYVRRTIFTYGYGAMVPDELELFQFEIEWL